MTKGYEVFRKGNDPGRDYRSYNNAVYVLVDKLPTGETYEWKRRGVVAWRQAASKPALKEALLDRRLKIGEAFYARRLGGTAVFVLRAVEVLIDAPPYPDPDGTPAIKVLWDAAWQAFRELGPGFEFVSMGTQVCRRIDGSLTWSQHAFHNAFDFRIRRVDGPETGIDVEATTKVVNKVKDQAAEALWLVSGHFYHAHLTGDPKQYGTPECA